MVRTIWRSQRVLVFRFRQILQNFAILQRQFNERSGVVVRWQTESSGDIVLFDLRAWNGVSAKFSHGFWHTERATAVRVQLLGREGREGGRHVKSFRNMAHYVTFPIRPVVNHFWWILIIDSTKCMHESQSDSRGERNIYITSLCHRVYDRHSMGF